MRKRFSARATVMLMLLASVFTCVVISATVGRELGLFSDRYTLVRQYAAMLRVVESRYVGEYDTDEIAASAMKAAVDTLDDQWSFYMTRDEFLRYLDRSSNRYTGIGVLVTEEPDAGGIRVEFVHRNSPAQIAGIVAGDIIIAVDGTDTTDIGLDQLRDLLARPLETLAQVTVLREDETIEDLSVVFSIIFTDPIMFEMLDDNIGYIEIANFNTGAAKSFISATEDLVQQGASAFIYDVRGNGGGMLSEMVGILEYLLDQGELFVSVDKKGSEEIIFSDGPGMVDLPTVVLINRESYSAAEYFAAILREYDYAVIVGQQTSGKGRSQQLFRLPGGGAINLSSAEYFTKNRVNLFDAGGVTPDHILLLSDENFALLMAGTLEKTEDSQLNLAIELLRR